MKFTSLQQFLKGKTILVTLVQLASWQKLVRIQSDLKKLYLLVISSDTDTATRRMHDEVLRDKWNEKFDSMISEKVAAVAGDVSLVNLGINAADLEKFDIAMGKNTMGALHVLNFSKSCNKVHVFLHVSTDGPNPERGLKNIINISRKEIDGENNRRNHRSQYIGDERAIRSAIKEFGIKRANLYGWPNTYVFTKAMGEMLLSQYKQDPPLVIIRPTIVTSTYKEPFPGWIEGLSLRTLDSVIGGNDKGKKSCFLGHPKTNIDVIPADMVINCMLAAMVIHYSNKASDNKYIYHVLYLGNKMCCQIFQDSYSQNDKKIKMVELYKPYVFFRASFDDAHSEKLRTSAKMLKDVGFELEFDAKSIDWRDYFMNVHIPGLVNYVLT